MAKTTRAIEVGYLENIGFGVRVMLPEGTELVQIECGTGPAYAVKSVELLQQLTGNMHDPVYRYCIVPDEVVDILQVPGTTAPGMR